ncbi:LysR substrate-binding domain-containing protein [Arthrobacter sp. 35W]|uniref:LysR substrate-binding domain-containing protein n=1 Tax=Arthrobacter sp. 35W TaxID=1132441 RepID=UPI0003F52DD5|nr:LysR substrate-binding domain-containing protein [Arthrobacter sp. 35W]
MNLHQLKAFRAVATERSFTGAAAFLGLSQPTVSAHVGALEQEFGVQLLQRTARGTSTTELGDALLPLVDTLLESWNAAALLLKNHSTSAHTVLRLGADAPINAMGILERFTERFPAVDIRLTTGNSRSVRADVLAGLVDVGVVSDGTVDPALKSYWLAAQDLVVFVRDDSYLAGSKSVPLARLAREVLVIREVGSVTRRALTDALSREDVEPAGFVDVDSRESLQAAVLAGLGVGVIAEDEFTDHPRLVVLDVEGAPMRVDEFLIHRTDRAGAPVVAGVVECLRPA